MDVKENKSSVDAAAGASRFRWRLAWRSRLTSYVGHGSGSESRAAVEVVASVMNVLFPYIEHWCEPADGAATTDAAVKQEVAR